MARYAHRMRRVETLLLVAVACLLLVCTPRTALAMMDMPDDPVNGEMVMSTEYNFQLRNGQRLRFASAETLQQFVKDPSSGLGDVVMAAGDKTAHGEASLCPVCGMENAVSGGPTVLMKHGDQTIHTCSMFHAHQVHDEILTLREAAATDKTAATTSEEQPFCTGSGTSMLNGFAFFQSARDSSACVLLWFPGWVLNTRWRYLLGCLTVVLCAMFNEYLLKLRRILRKESNAKRILVNGSASESSMLLRPRAYSASSPSPASSTGVIATWFRGLSADTQHMVHCVLHGVTIMLAYMLMLVSMTYDGILFLCCIVGYIIGYFVFGERREVVPDADSLTFGTA